MNFKGMNKIYYEKGEVHYFDYQAIAKLTDKNLCFLYRNELEMNRLS